MAVEKVISTRALVIEVQGDVDKDGNPVYKKKTFSGVRISATEEGIQSVADAIKVVLKDNTRRTYLNEVSLLQNI